MAVILAFGRVSDRLNCKACVTISTGCRNCDAGWPANSYQFLLKCVCTSSQLSGRKRFPSTHVKLSGIWHSSCLTSRADAENQISSAEEPQRLVKSAKGVR